MNVKVKGQGHQGQKTCLSLPTPPWCVRMVCARCKQHAAAADRPILWLLWGFRVSYASSTPVGKSAHAVYCWHSNLGEIFVQCT